MMAIIGFLGILIFGCVLCVAAILASYVCFMFSGRIEWMPVIFYGGFGGALIYAAVTHAPFAITFIGAAK